MNYVTICLGTTLTPSIKWTQRNLQGKHFRRWTPNWT